MTLPRKIAVTGMGAICAAGASPERLWDSIEGGVSGLGALTLFESPRCGGAPVGEVRLDPSSGSGLPGGSRTDHLAVWAARQAVESSGLLCAKDVDAARIAVVLGTTTGGMIDAEEFLSELIKRHRLDVSLLQYHLCSTSCNAISDTFGFGGLRVTVSDACASGASAIATACDILAAGDADIVVAGGADSLTRLTINGFSSLLNVDPGGCRPFDANRKGMSLGEGAGVIVLERPEHAVSRGAAVRGFVAGCGSSCDAYHATRPAPDGRGAYRAMAAALNAAGLRPCDVDYINAHGTGTVENDAAEAAAIAELFAGRIPYVSSTKGYTGHTLAAAGAIETIICLEAVAHAKAPGTLGLETPDPRLGFTPVSANIDASLAVALTNSLGFGGTNTSVVVTSASWGGAS